MMKQFLRRLAAAICTAGLLLSAASALTVEQALELLEENYVDRLPAAAYEATTLDELFQAIGDPYTYYMSAEEYQSFINSVEGESKVGIGVAIQYQDTGLLISRIIPGGTAEEAGLEAGDTIIAVDGESCVPGKEGDVSRVTGEEGTQVTLEILRADGTRQTLTLTRRGFTVPTTTVSLWENGSGYIACDSFGSTTGAAFAEGIGKYDGQADLWVVDVRSNTGGLIGAAQDTVGAFTGPSFVAWLRDANGRYSYSLNLSDALTEDPAVVLTNIYSASASEIFSSAIKDTGVGIVVGTRTYGKGVAQIVLDGSTDPDLFDGDALKITAYRFYSPALNTTDSIGTLPTLMLPDEQVSGAALLLQAQEPKNPAGWLRLTLNGLNFYVDAASALADEGGTALSAVFAALPPDTEPAVWQNGAWTSMTVAQAAAAVGADYTSRWFNDVDGSPYAEELNTMATYGLLKGVGGRAYDPDGTLTRAELCAMLCQALNRKSSAPSSYSDVADSAWYAPYVAKATEMGLMTGKGKGIFDPNGLVTQEELVTVLGRLAGFLNANCYELLGDVEDVDLDGRGLDDYADWARTYAWLLGDGYRENIDESVSALFFAAPNELEPTAAVTRAEAGAALCRLLIGLGVLSY